MNFAISRELYKELNFLTNEMQTKDRMTIEMQTKDKMTINGE